LENGLKPAAHHFKFVSLSAGITSTKRGYKVVANVQIEDLQVMESIFIARIQWRGYILFEYERKCK
jgi:hypothetical protein